jgi:hypothetical protein
LELVEGSTLADRMVQCPIPMKVLDFGFVKAFDPAGSSSAGATMSPTLSIHATQALHPPDGRVDGAGAGTRQSRGPPRGYSSVRASRSRIFRLKSRTSTSRASSACRRLMPRRPKAVRICFRKALASLSTFRQMLDSCTPSIRAISARVRPSR